MADPVTLDDIYALFQTSQAEADRRAESDRRAAEADRRAAEFDLQLAQSKSKPAIRSRLLMTQPFGQQPGKSVPGEILWCRPHRLIERQF
ncbi:MAG: hypothetical protein WBG38_17055 [Nodosilinea sp.]